MNGCLFFITIIYLIRWQLSALSVPLIGSGFWLSLQKALKNRDYLLRSIAPQTRMEERLKGHFQEGIKRGDLKLSDLESLGEFYAASSRQQGELKALLATYTTHLCFVLLVPLSIRMLLSGHPNFSLKDLPCLGAAFIGLLVIARLLQRAWPIASLAREDALWDFVLAYRGERECGAWKVELESLSREAWATGIDSTVERKERLREWHRGEASNFDQRQAFLENCLGPAELVMTCFFALVLLAMPLLSYFRTLVPG